MNLFNETAQAAGGMPRDFAALKALYNAVSTDAMLHLEPVWRRSMSGKRACYFSAEFLLGRMVYANLFNMGLLGELRQAFVQNGLDAAVFEEVEDAALGNGGLGRLAACFLDSAATMGLALDGYGIRYRYGLFRQSFKNGFQQEAPDDWTFFGDPWSIRRESARVRVDFLGQSVWAVPYDTPVIGYGGKTVNTLRLWQAEPLEAMDFGAYNLQDYGGAFKAENEAKAISAVLYPNDETAEGKKLRLKQQYFFASASLQSLLRDYVAHNGEDFSRLPNCYAIQLNDTHPVIAVPELLRLLMGGYGLMFREAFPLVQQTFAYTNHTIMAEALEKWDVALFCSVVPEVYPYVVMLQNHLKRELSSRGIVGKAQQAFDIVQNGRIHMARMAVYSTHSTNGVAALHTNILKEEVMREWHALWPHRFSNKTNGITQRRWLGLCNPDLAAFITQRIGDGWLCDLAQLEKLVPYADDLASVREFAAVKRQNKERLAQYVQMHENCPVSADSIFDVQIKRLHEYKRQLLNAFSILDIYFALKDGTLANFAPMTFLFGAKAAPGYRRAKGIIKYINEIAKMVNADPAAKGLLKVVFVQNYNVSYAEKLIPAADLSEQISTAGTEASGTGNMKLMLNGAVTLGTYDGANIEIVAESGFENNFIFGNRVEDIRAMANTYNPKAVYKSSKRIACVVDTLVDGTFSDGNTGVFKELHESLLEGAEWHRPDQYYLLADFESYVDAKLAANLAWQDKDAFARMCLLNTAYAGVFSSDRTIRQYSNEIWML